MCYSGKLTQAFLKLLSNASQSIEGKGVITVRTGSTDEMVWLEVQDTGKGISERNIAEVFDPFYTTKDIGEGTGLGLHFVMSVIENHGGTISVSSSLNIGTTFYVELPLTL